MSSPPLFLSFLSLDVVDFFFFGHTSGKGQEECPQERVCVCACVRDVSVASFFG